MANPRPRCRAHCSAVVALAGVLAAQSPPQLRLEGIVEDGRARPLPAAELTVERDGVAIARTAADATGWFVFGRLPVGDLVLHARSEGRAGAVRLELETEHMVVRVRTWPTRTLQVSVRDSNGEPARGAAVVAAANGPAPLDEVCTRGVTDAAGRCTLRDVVIGSVDVRAQSGTAPVASTTVAGTDEEEVELAVDTAPQRRIRVVYDGANAAQIAAARVLFWCEGHSKPAAGEAMPVPGQPLRFLPDGTLAIDWLPADLRVWIAVFDDDDRFAQMTDFVPPFQRDAVVHFKPQPPAAFQMRISDDGRALAGVALLVHRGRLPAAVVKVTDAAGELRIPSLLVGSPVARVRAFTDQWVLSRVLSRSDEDAVSVGSVLVSVGFLRELCATRPARLTGRVVDCAGRPAPGTEVALQHQSRVAALAAGRLAIGVDCSSATSCLTGIDGLFVSCVPALPRDELMLVARGPHGHARIGLPAAAADGSTRVELVLEAPDLATGVVVDGDGKPVAGARLVATPSAGVRLVAAPPSAWDDREQFLVVTERDGSFVLAGHGGGTFDLEVGKAKVTLGLGSGATSLPPFVVER